MPLFSLKIERCKSLKIEINELRNNEKQWGSKKTSRQNEKKKEN